MGHMNLASILVVFNGGHANFKLPSGFIFFLRCGEKIYVYLKKNELIFFLNLLLLRKKFMVMKFSFKIIMFFCFFRKTQHNFTTLNKIAFLEKEQFKNLNFVI